jgi:dUTP pyrophosphatase
MSESYLLDNYGRYMSLKIYVDSDDEELREKYRIASEKHNSKLYNNTHIDAGFDLFAPKDQEMYYDVPSNKLDYNIICSAEIIEAGRKFNTGFYIYPRSSISKTPLRLANNVGIIDAGYRGHLIGMFDAVYRTSINKFDRFAQICAPGLIPIYIDLVSSVEELGQQTQRGEGGIGSTGK